ncbi:hypothetical protein ACRAKI_17950 [Saccharothrix isguenensis]
MARDAWVAETSRDFTSLRGRRVESWVGVEMALRESVAGGAPQFDDPEVPCLQLLGLQASLDHCGVLTVSVHQDHDVFGLWPRSHPEVRFQDEGQWNGIYRWRALTELPTGHVEYVAAFVDKGVLAEVGLRIDGRPLLLVAGELEETSEGGLLFHRLDESVLVFTDTAAAARVPWTTSRHGLVRTEEGCTGMGGQDSAPGPVSGSGAP